MPITSSIRRIAVVFSLFWIFFVLYPLPTNLGKSVYRVFDPPVNPGAVKEMVSLFPGPPEPHLLERFVLDYLPYKYDWQAYGMPWYFPTPEEALDTDKGDCKSRMIVMASLFEALAIPYELYVSPVHIWISYEGKVETEVENKAAAMFTYDGEEFRLKLPQVDWTENFNLFWEAFWVYMPLERKIMLVSGLIFSLYLFFILPLSFSPGLAGYSFHRKDIFSPGKEARISWKCSPLRSNPRRSKGAEGTSSRLGIAFFLKIFSR